MANWVRQYRLIALVSAPVVLKRPKKRLLSDSWRSTFHLGFPCGRRVAGQVVSTSPRYGEKAGYYSCVPAVGGLPTATETLAAFLEHGRGKAVG